MYLWHHQARQDTNVCSSTGETCWIFRSSLYLFSMPKRKGSAKISKWNLPSTAWFFSHRQVSPHTVTYQRTRRERALLQISSLLSSEVARGKETNQKRAEIALDAFTQHSCRNSSSCNLRFNHKTIPFLLGSGLDRSRSRWTRVGIPWAEKSLSPKDCRWNSEPSSTPLSRSGRCWRP